MPVIKCPNGKFRIGGGKCMYRSKASAVKAYKAYLAKNPSADETETLEKGLPEEFENEWVDEDEVTMDDIFNAYRRVLLQRRSLPKGAYYYIPVKGENADGKKEKAETIEGAKETCSST